MYMYIYIYIYIACFPLCLTCTNIETNCSVCWPHSNDFIELITSNNLCKCKTGSFYEDTLSTFHTCYSIY